ncbi:MAG TPA: hypothetical protein VFM45_05655, partial [Anaeromyxobacteraceae bacterium]|nr:hypothetical protein [Anaeromyxobacteraceae bacterium]
APTRLRDLAIANHALGRARESAAALAELERDHGDQRFLIAEARAYRGDRDGALRLLEAAVESRDPYLGRIKISWALRPLRDDARYVALLRKMKLPVEPPL